MCTWIWHNYTRSSCVFRPANFYFKGVRIGIKEIDQLPICVGIITGISVTVSSSMSCCHCQWWCHYQHKHHYVIVRISLMAIAAQHHCRYWCHGVVASFAAGDDFTVSLLASASLHCCRHHSITIAVSVRALPATALQCHCWHDNVVANICIMA